MADVEFSSLSKLVEYYYNECLTDDMKLIIPLPPMRAKVSINGFYTPLRLELRLFSSMSE